MFGRFTHPLLSFIPRNIRETCLTRPLAEMERLVSDFHRRRETVILDEGVLLRMDKGLSNTMVTLLRTGRHGREERQLIIPALEGNDVVMELGGGIGHMAIRCAKKIGSDRVLTFEANPRLAGIMLENFRLNAVSPKVDFCLLGREEGTTDFYIGDNFWSSSTVRAPYHDCTLTVPVRPFNKIVKTVEPTFLIIDIEGGEYELFQYADLRTVRKLMVEAHPKVLGAKKVDRMLKRISRLGFDLRQSIKDCYLFFRR
jgi:FkbM family methyltransferase